ncbi:MAG TPA: thioredoxin family protein [Ramlibacter sp.]|uniref:thioredoxin family protein n=1 Tax=Ramlibacter sp. TaxID=1917967 RepID=UPI002D7F2155|nr:thioredoxin family protein [Ramlibacter sp.]HET8746425.1 thioredoxin family protein [Ramlibacter sp.]
MRKRLFLALAAALALGGAGSALAQAGRFDPSRDAVADVEQAVARARAQGKSVLIDVGGEWCAWCHILDRFIAARPEVQRTLDQHYLLVKVNWSPQNRNEKLLSRWPKPSGYPHFYVLDGDGRLLVSQATSELEAGHDYDEAKVLAFLRRYAPAVR